MTDRWDARDFAGSGPLPSTLVSPVDRAEMVLVPAGEFTAGMTERDIARVFVMEKRQNPIFATEIPARALRLGDYYIDRYPVTNYQYRRFIEETSHRPPPLLDHPQWGGAMQPVVFVGWDDARAYARWADKALPTEGQWEKAARGTDGRWWTWGNEFRPGCCNSREQGIGRTSEIGLFDDGISPYGCYDMCGNVWEMCEGRWIEDLLPMRGGCFLGTAAFVRVTCRWTPEDPSGGAHWLGFRCVKEVKKTSKPI